MVSAPTLQSFQKHVPLIGDINTKSVAAYRTTRAAVAVFNTAQLAIAEA